MPLLTIDDVSIGYRGPQLLDGVTSQIDTHQRIGLLGRNGAGKTTLLRMLSGEVQPDHGQIVLAPGTTVGLMPQGIPRDLVGTVQEIVAAALPPASELPEEAWKHDHAVDQVLSRMGLDPEARFESMSSGMKRRVLLARTLVTEPDILLLDEPTNHLEIDAINWLEEFLLRWDGTFLFVTHDRMFLRKLANRILEIDRGQLFDWSCDYETFLQRKEAALEAEEKQNALFDKRLAQEEVWIRQGIKARRTRNEGRVKALKEMRKTRSERRSKQGSMRLEIQAGDRSGKLVAEVKDLSFAYDQRPIVSDFDTTIMRGDKIGIIGPNGAGKTTLLRLMLGELEPQAGSVRLGTNLQLAYFDQLRDQLHDEQTVQENVSEGYDMVGSGSRSQHIIGYLQNFLFNPERARTPVKFLSGGERNRVLLAKLFSKPANVIVLDEPTNDLDTESLELLEERLAEFEGTVLLVSHDREFLNNVVTSTIVFEADGVREYVGGYDDWLRQRPSEQAASAKAPSKKSAPQPANSAAESSKPRKISFNEKRELKRLPGEIEQLEAEIAAVHEKMGDPEFYQQPGEEIAQETERLKELDERLVSTFERMEELEELAD